MNFKLFCLALFMFGLTLDRTWSTAPTHSFTQGTIISSSEVNQNFSEIYNRFPLKVLQIEFANPVTFASGSNNPIAAGDIANIYIDGNVLSYSAGIYTAAAAGTYRVSTYAEITTGSPSLFIKVNGTTDFFLNNLLILKLSSTDTLSLRVSSTMGSSTLGTNSVIFFEKLD
jgi:hypothetical protein